MQVTTIGLDLAKSVFQVHGVDASGKVEPAAPPAAPAPVATEANAPPPSFGYANIKRFSFLGPLAFEVGVAKDAAATESDVVVEMRFVGGDWRVVGVKPRI